MEEALIKVAAFVCTIVAGYLAGRSGKLGQAPGAVLSKIVFTFTLPCAVVHAFGSADFTPALLLLVPLGLAFALGAYGVTLLITRRCERTDRVFFLLSSCGFNIGCFALPFVQAVFPATMAVATCMFDAGNAVMMAGGSYALTGVTAGTSRVAHPARFIARKLIGSIPFDAYLLIIVLALAGIHLPQEVVQFTEPIAQANSFLALFMLGLMMSFSASRERVAKVAELVGLRVVYACAFTALAFVMLPFDTMTKWVIALLVWGPASALAPTYTQMSGGDGGLAGFANACTIVIGVVAATVIAILSGAAA